jgi:hypothetical protein
MGGLVPNFAKLGSNLPTPSCAQMPRIQFNEQIQTLKKVKITLKWERNLLYKGAEDGPERGRPPSGDRHNTFGRASEDCARYWAEVVATPGADVVDVDDVGSMRLLMLNR